MILDEAIRRYTNNAEYEQAHGNLQGCLDFEQLAEWLEELKQLREQNKWIPISKETPKKQGYYITSTIYNEVYCDYWNGDNFDRTEAVLAWQELPEPYRAENEGKKIHVEAY